MIDRREFLAASASLFVAGRALLGWSAEAPANDVRRPIKIANKARNLGATPEEIRASLKTYKDAGYDGIEPQSPGLENRTALRDVSQELDLPIHGVVNRDHWRTRLSSPSQAEREASIASFKEAIRDSHFLGGTSVLVVPGNVTGPDETHDHVWHRSISGLKELIPLAGELKIHLLIENVKNGFCESPALARDYLDEIDSKWVGAYFDIGNAVRHAPAEEWIRTLGDRIVKLDVKDRTPDMESCRLGEGIVDWAEVGKALDEIGFAGWATREGKDNSLADTVQLIDRLLVQR